MKNIKDEFISTLSHEIRTPLTSIKGFSKTILDNWENLSDEQKKKFLKIIQEQSQRLINLVENVLNVSKIDSDRGDIVLKKISLKDAINNASSLVKMNYGDFDYDIKICSNEPVLADENKLQQVLINLLDNASKYSKNSKKVEISLTNNKNSAIICIKNYGVQIEEKYFDKIFDKFYRIENILNSTTQGSGLGLYITKKLLEQMKGEITVRSYDEPKSTEFVVTLPLYEIEQALKRVSE